MKKQVCRELTPLQRAYLPEVLRGLWITSGHFFANLSAHLLHLIGLARRRKGMVTWQYPEEPRPPARRFRGQHRIMKRADGTTRCVACMMCEVVCPAHCIYIVGEEHPDPRVEKRPRVFEVDLGLCVVCGYCVEACPEDAIRMDTYIRNTASYDRAGMILDLAALSDHDNEDLYPGPGPFRPRHRQP